MSARRPVSRWRRLVADRRGVAAVEFALLVPLVIIVYMAGFEVMEASTVYRKLTDTTVQLANVTAQYTSLTQDDADNVLGASAQIMTPYPTANLSITLSEVTVNSGGVGQVTWTCQWPSATNCQTSGGTVTMPSGFQTSGDSYVLVQTAYEYEPVIGGAFIKPIKMTNQIFMLPRSSPTIPYKG